MISGVSSVPSFLGNYIHSGQNDGAKISGSARVRFERNRIIGNKGFGIIVLDKGSFLTMSHNFVENNSLSGVGLFEGASGRFERNHFKGNKGGPWRISPNAGSVERIDNIEE